MSNGFDGSWDTLHQADVSLCNIDQHGARPVFL